MSDWTQLWLVAPHQILLSCTGLLHLNFSVEGHGFLRLAGFPSGSCEVLKKYSLVSLCANAVKKFCNSSCLSASKASSSWSLIFSVPWVGVRHLSTVTFQLDFLKGPLMLFSFDWKWGRGTPNLSHLIRLCDLWNTTCSLQRKLSEQRFAEKTSTYLCPPCTWLWLTRVMIQGLLHLLYLKIFAWWTLESGMSSYLNQNWEKNNSIEPPHFSFWVGNYYLPYLFFLAQQQQ